jgi:hypothetical protein
MTSIKYLHEIVTSTLTLLLSIVCWYYLSCLVYVTLSSQLYVYFRLTAALLFFRGSYIYFFLEPLHLAWYLSNLLTLCM